MKVEKLIKILFYTVFSLKAIESLTLFSHGDALNYHLVIPRLVLEYSWSNVFETFFAVFLSGYLELVYFIPNLFFGNTIYTQLMAQFIQFWLTFGLSSWLFLRYINNKTYAYLACLSLLTVSKGADFLLYAKNDGFLATICLWLFFEVLTKKKEDWNPLYLGVFFGLIPSIKLSGLFFLAPLFLYLVWSKKFDIKFTAKIGLIAFFIHLPIFIIKAKYLGGAIFFPALLSIFPGNLAKNTISLFNSFTNKSITWDSFGNYMLFFFAAKVIFAFYLPTIYKSRKQPKAIFSAALVLINFILILILNGGVYGERFLFPMLFTLIGSFFYFLQDLNISKKYLGLMLVIIFVDSKIDKTVKRTIGVLKYPTQDMAQLRREEIPLSTVWDHIQTIPNKEFTYVFSDDFVQTFYSPKGIRVDMFPSSPNTADYSDCTNVNFLEKFNYFIMRWKFGSPCNEIIKKTSEKIYQIGPYHVLRKKNESN